MSIWPKTYLLRLLNQAVAEGSCTVKCLDEKQAKSLAGALNRIRRRKDATHNSFISPEHHMVTATPQGSDLYVLYSTLPEGFVMPEIVSGGPPRLHPAVEAAMPSQPSAPAVSIDSIMGEIARRAFEQSTDDSGMFGDEDD